MHDRKEMGKLFAALDSKAGGFLLNYICYESCAEADEDLQAACGWVKIGVVNIEDGSKIYLDMAKQP